MTKGRTPDQALREARAIARRQGDLCENHRSRGILYDIAIHLALSLIYVRVKRTKYEAETIAEILVVCDRDIAKLRKIPMTAGLLRELWVREPNGMASSRPIREDAPGPDRSGVLPAAPLAGKFFCPFIVSSK